jgi:flagella basal body P-ring formation protein FlgA
MRIRVQQFTGWAGQLAWSAMLVLFMNGFSLAGQIEIDLTNRAEINGSSITLGQLGTIKGGNDQVRNMLNEIELGPSPKPGRAKWITKSQIQSRLQTVGIDLNALTIRASGPVKVLRGYEGLTATKVCDAVKNYIYQAAPWDRSQIKIRSVSYHQNHSLPPGRLELRVMPPKHTDWIGAIPFRVDAMVDGRLVRKLSVPAHIEVWSDVYVAAKPLGRNQPIKPSDLKIKRMNLSRTPSNAILHQDQILGQRTKRAIAINAILTMAQIETPPVIRKGDVVQLIAEGPLLKVTTKGVAKDKGGIGERIRVVNLNSKRVVHAQIVNYSTVRVSF